MDDRKVHGLWRDGRSWKLSASDNLRGLQWADLARTTNNPDDGGRSKPPAANR